MSKGVSIRIPKAEEAVLRMVLKEKYQETMDNMVLAFARHLKLKNKRAQYSGTVSKTFKIAGNFSVKLAYYYWGTSPENGSIKMTIPALCGSVERDWEELVEGTERKAIEGTILGVEDV
jgi:hypothetical protein